jgi:hypothetical protein
MMGNGLVNAVCHYTTSNSSLLSHAFSQMILYQITLVKFPKVLFLFFYFLFVELKKNDHDANSRAFLLLDYNDKEYPL